MILRHCVDEGRILLLFDHALAGNKQAVPGYFRDNRLGIGKFMLAMLQESANIITMSILCLLVAACARIGALGDHQCGYQWDQVWPCNAHRIAW